MMKDRSMALFNNRNKEKIFCIGRNKTGTTSIYKALEDFGYRMGDQKKAELLNKDYAKRNWKPILDYCHSAEAFQDIPFSLPYTFIVLDNHFPNSKFILTERDSDEQWYDSFIRFQKKKHGGGKLPSKEVLMNNTYAYKGFTYDNKKLFFGTPDDDLYNKEIMIEHYNYHSKRKATKY